MKRVQDGLMYKNHSAVKVGELNRYVIEYTPLEDPLQSQQPSSSLWLRVKNLEAIPMRAAYLMGPFVIYVDLRSGDFNHKKSCFITADQPSYEPNVQAGQSFYAELSMHTIKEKYVWVVDIVSQILFLDSTEVNFEVMVGKNKSVLEDIRGSIENGNYSSSNLKVTHLDTVDLWNFPAPDLEKPIHLVMLTHGLFSNVGADMYFLKEEIDKKAKETGENVMVKGYQDNVCKTEKGVKFLGKGIGEFIVKDLLVNYPTVEKISFIGHSLGGLSQTYAIAYILKNYPDFFQKVKPEKFITLASPLLGIANENPAYVKISLTLGVVGRTGQDLGLMGSSPLLLKLPSGPTHHILKMFKQRTIYANVLHDGIVPLRTSALLFLDWKGLAEVTYARKHDTDPVDEQQQDLVAAATNASDTTVNSTSEDVTQIPETEYNDKLESGDFLPYISGKVLSPFQAMLSLCAPMVKLDEHEIAKYKRYQTVREGDNEDSGPVKFKKIPKSSMIQSAASVLLPPLPPNKFICDPNLRENVILHDKVYQESDLPPEQVQQSPSVLDHLNPETRFHKLEDEIARLWHKDMAWRKVLVCLKPDAHNNIVVRRRFANAYGWGVIEHLVDNHFGVVTEKELDPDQQREAQLGSDEKDDLDWINDEEENEEVAYDKDAEDSKKLDGGDPNDDITNEMIMSGYYN